MTVVEFLSYLNSIDIKIWADGDRLRYNAPKEALTPALRAELAARKAEILAFLRQADVSQRSASQAIPPAPRDGALPLSFAQQRLWFLDQLEPESPVYNIPFAVRLKGPLNVAALALSINQVIERHETLRTTFASASGQPAQVIAPTLALALPVVDLQVLPENVREAEAQRLAAEEARRLFDLRRGPLLRATLLRLDETNLEEHILLLSVHHIVFDGWSMGVFFRELTRLYEALIRGTPSPLPELPIQYADFAVWQQQWLQGQVLQDLLSYWQQQLAGIPLLELPTDHPRPVVQTWRGARQSRQLAQPLVEALQALSQREGVIPFMALLAAFETLLYRYTGQEDIVLGTPMANRQRAETKGLIGFFVNTLVLRTPLAGDPTFRELLGQVREVVLQARAHQALSFERLVEKLQVERDLSRTPLFQVMFALQRIQIKMATSSGLTLSAWMVDSGAAKFDLLLEVIETAPGLQAAVEYNTDLFEAATMQRLLGHYERLLAGTVSEPERRISSLSLLTEAEQHQLLVEWNDTRSDYRSEGCLQALFEAQVERTPDAVAVAFPSTGSEHSESQHLTYRALNRRANQTARYLQSLGAGPEVQVGICVERSPEMVIGIYGILKAGGAYAPLDPTYPPERLAFMLADAQTPVLLTQERLAGRLPRHAAQVVCLDTAWSKIAYESEENPPGDATPDNLAYVIYTSGSTGLPKGAMNTHRGICNRLLWMQAAYHLTAADCVVQKTPFSFDVSVWEFFWPLLNGARLAIAQPEGHKDSDYLARLIEEQQVTTLHFVPSMLQVFLEEPSLERCRSLRRVICSGEALPYALQQRFFDRLEAELHNLYGPTEAAVDVTFWDCQQHSPRPVVPIGCPIANTQLYILDRQLQPTPVGVPGELHIGGVGLGRGYHNRPALTADKFVPHPFGLTAGDRLYKTGDLARYLPDGSIDFLGRLDYQVKIRGFRIELGEIETALLQHSTVREAIVTVRENAPGDRRLVAYVVPQERQTLAVDALRSFLKTRLPDYMLPTAFVVLEAMPLTPNGKVDRRALPSPDLTRPEAAMDSTAPRNAGEEHIAAVWAEVLGIEGFGIDDNFFELGGESFKAIRTVRRIGESVSVIDLFQHPTVRELAEHLAQGRPKRDGLLYELTQPLPARDRVISLVCIPYAGGSAIVYQPLAQALPGNYTLYAVEIPGHDFSRRDETLQPLEQVARQCAEQIRRDLTGPIALYGHCLGGALTIEIARLLEKAHVELVGVFIGGHFPSPRLPGRFFDWLARILPSDRWLSSRGYYELLRGLGGFADVIQPEEQAFLINSVRHDARQAEEYYSRAYARRDGPRLQAPILCLVGQMDRLTEFYEERVAEWQFFGRSVDLVVLPQAGHYFVKQRAAELAHIISGQLTAWQDGAASRPSPATQERLPDRRAEPATVSSKRTLAPSLLTFLIIALGQFVSTIGSSLTLFAMGVWLYQRTGAVSDLGVIAVFTLLPGILVSPFAGAMVDRWDRRQIMIWSDAAAACATLALALLLWTNSLHTWHIVIMASISSLANAFQRPAYIAAVAQLVPKQYLGNVNGLVQLADAASRLVAPLLGGVLLMAVGLHGIVLVDFATFLFAVTTLLLVRFPDTLFRKQQEPLLREIVKGWSFIIRRRGLVAMVVFFVVINYFIGLLNVLTTPLVLSFGTPAVLGTVTAANGLGLLIGGLVMSLWGGAKRRASGMIGFFALFGLSAIVMGSRPAFLYLAIGFFGLGFSLALGNAHWQTLIQTKVGFELQGRVVSTNQMLSWSTLPLGYATAGPLADGLFEPFMAGRSPLAAAIGQLIGVGPGRGMGLLVILTGLLVLLWTALSYRYRPLRFMEDELPDAIPDAVIAANRDKLQELADRRLLTGG